MPRLRQHSCLQAYALGDLAKYANPGKVLSYSCPGLGSIAAFKPMPWVTLAEYANPGRVLSHMTRLRQHSCLQAYALGDLAKYANPGKVLSLHTQA